MALLVLIAAGTGVPPASASWLLPPEFTQVATTPADFQNSTILSVAVNSGGASFASSGFNVATVPFDGSESISTPLPFTSPFLAVTQIGFDAADRLNLLMLNDSGPGSVWRSNNGNFSEYVEFGPNQGGSRAFAFDGSGTVVVGGDSGNLGQNGWIRKYNSTGGLVAAFDVAEGPVGLAFTSNGNAYMASLDGKLFAVSNTGLTLVGQLPSAWVGFGVGNVESFAIDASDDFFFGVDLGQRFGVNSGAILRLSKTNDVDVLALGVGDIPVDLAFSPGNELLVGSFNPYSGSKVFKFSGDFSGQISTPEPASIALLGSGVFGLIGYSWCCRKESNRKLRSGRGNPSPESS